MSKQMLASLQGRLHHRFLWQVFFSALGCICFCDRAWDGNMTDQNHTLRTLVSSLSTCAHPAKSLFCTSQLKPLRIFYAFMPMCMTFCLDIGRRYACSARLIESFARHSVMRAAELIVRPNIMMLNLEKCQIQKCCQHKSQHQWWTEFKSLQIRCRMTLTTMKKMSHPLEAGSAKHQPAHRTAVLATAKLDIVYQGHLDLISWLLSSLIQILLLTYTLKGTKYSS